MTQDMLPRSIRIQEEPAGFQYEHDVVLFCQRTHLLSISGKQVLRNEVFSPSFDLNLSFPEEVGISLVFPALDLFTCGVQINPTSFKSWILLSVSHVFLPWFRCAN